MSKSLQGLLKPKNKLTKIQLGIFIAVFAVIGGVILLLTQAAPNPNLPGDLNGDNVVNASDLSLLLTNFGTTNSVADINSDGHVNVLDMSILLAHYGQTISGGFTNTSLPTISGSATVGSTLTAANGTWTPTPSSFSYAWQICDSTGSNCSRSSMSVATSNTYVIQSSDAGHTVRVQVAPNGDFNYSKDSAPTALVTTSSGGGGGSGSVLFDGRAKLMSALKFSSTFFTPSTQVGPTAATFNKTYWKYESPAIWDGMTFLDNIFLTSDSIYGKAYKASIAIGDSNVFQQPGLFLSENKGAGQITKIRPNDLGKWDYFAMATKVPSWSGNPAATEWADFASLGYQTSRGDQFAFRLTADSSSPTGLSYSVEANVGYASDPAVFHADHYWRQLFMPLKFNQWDEWAFAIKWATDSTGAVQVYHRVPGGTWSKVLEKLNTPTYLYGTTSYGTFNQDGSNWTTVLDKIGLYYGLYPAGTTETVYESGLTRSSDLATAESTLP